MHQNRNRNFKLDWITIILFLLLIGFGWLNILSASASGEVTSYFDMSQPYGKQLVFILFTFILIILILSIEAKFYERFASIIYIASMASLLGLFVFGKEVNGATSWYSFGNFSFQPSEFVKSATALAMAKLVSDKMFNLKKIETQIQSIIILFFPALLITLQPDPGSALVYAAFIFVLYREGLPFYFVAIGIVAIILFISTLLF